MGKSVYVDTDLYLRLSREDDEKQQESDSIKNQKALLMDFLKAHPELRLRKIHVDDGYSGVSFQRPAFQEMLADIKKGLVKCIVVKDLSRFGRNWLEVGEYVQHLFPFLGVRFISVNDNAVLKAVQLQIEQVVELSELLKYISELPADENKSKRLDEEIRRQTEEAERLEKRKLRLYEHFSEGIINKEDYRRMNELYSKEIRKIDSVLKNRKQEKQALQNSSEKQRWMKLYQQYHTVKELDRRLVVTLIDRIYVYEDKRIEIVFRFRDEYNSLLALLEQAASKEAI